MPYLKLSHARRSAYQRSGDVLTHEYGPIFGPYPFFNLRPDGILEFGAELTERLYLVKGLLFYAGTYYAGWSVFTGPPLPDEAVYLVPFDPAQADPADPPIPCACQLPDGDFFCGVPGVLAHLEDGRVSDDFRVERCDLCRRYPSDSAARRKLHELGLIAGPAPNLPTFTVECQAVVRVTVRDVPAKDLRAAAREARAMFDWYRFRQDAMFDGEFRRFIVSPESVLPGESRIRPPRQFHGELVELAASRVNRNRPVCSGHSLSPLIRLKKGASMPREREQEKSRTRPVHEVRLGRIKAAVWENQTQNGTRHNVTLSRLYKDGDQWKDSASFGRDDLPLVMKVADLAHTWIFQQAGASANNGSADENGGDVHF